MKKIAFIFLLAISFVTAKAQQQYRALLDSYYQHSQTNFKEIFGEQTDTESIFYPSKLNPDLGKVEIGKYPNVNVLNWKIPLDQSKEIQIAVQEFMNTTYSDQKKFKTISDGSEEEGDLTTNVYKLGEEKPLLVFQTTYYRNNDDKDKSQFLIMMYGK